MTYARIARRIRVPLGFVLAAVYIWLAHPTWLSLAMGAAIALAGVAIRAAASGHITKNAALTTTGPYAYTRNPLYLGSIVIGAGFALAALNWWIVLAIAALFVAIYLPVIGSEEEFLRATFPGYDDYARRVPRLLPRLRKDTGVAHPSRLCLGGGSFSWERYRKHREYNALLGTMIMIVALAVKLVWAR
jgi:protein-S-isoprenylcysteine O-methyltransferase Ste14